MMKKNFHFLKINDHPIDQTFHLWSSHLLSGWVGTKWRVEVERIRTGPI